MHVRVLTNAPHQKQLTSNEANEKSLTLEREVAKGYSPGHRRGSRKWTTEIGQFGEN